MAASKDAVDVLIVGSGAAGGPFAWQLSKVPGLKIMCLEQGEWRSKPAYSANTEAQSQRQRQRLAAPPSPKPGVKQNPGGYPYDYSQSYWQPILGNAVGGATLHYTAVWARFHPFDFTPS